MDGGREESRGGGRGAAGTGEGWRRLSPPRVSPAKLAAGGARAGGCGAALPPPPKGCPRPGTRAHLEEEEERGRKKRRCSSSSSRAVRAESRGAAGAPCPALAPRRLPDAPPRLTSGTSWCHPGRPPELGFQGSAARTGSSSLPPLSPLSLSGTLTLRLLRAEPYSMLATTWSIPRSSPLGAMPPGAGVLPGQRAGECLFSPLIPEVLRPRGSACSRTPRSGQCFATPALSCSRFRGFSWQPLLLLPCYSPS